MNSIFYLNKKKEMNYTNNNKKCCHWLLSEVSSSTHNGFTLLWSKDKNAEKINFENTGETVLTLTHRSPPTPSFLFSTFLLSTKVRFTVKNADRFHL
jgi:hypothetical protein